MSRIEKAFQNGKAFIAFLTCGDPDLQTTLELVKAMEQAGADLVELGIPFSDPVAEGPVIQGANVRALAGGVTTDKILEMVRRLREEVSIPLLFMTYANVVFSYGTERFLKAAADAGIDGLILPDVPYEEREDFAPACQKYGVDYIPLVAPTSRGRVQRIAESAQGFVYCVSSMGVTGERSSLSGQVSGLVEEVRKFTPVPAAVGFGVSTPRQAAQVAAAADGVIVGSAIVRLVEQYGRDAAGPVSEFVKAMKTAIRDAKYE